MKSSIRIISSLFIFSISAPFIQSVNADALESVQSASILPKTESYFQKSSITGTEYQIFISTPLKKAPKGGFPIIYLTDANGCFGTMVETVRSFSRGGTDKTEAIVVGIGYPLTTNIKTARALDLTTKLGSATTPKGFGGATDFLRFILNEVKPKIEKRLPIDKTRQTLFGHSFGGLFALQTLINEPSAFQTYLIASPSIWWGERHSFQGNFFGRLSPKLEITGATPRVLITVGELEQPKVKAKQPKRPPSNRPILPGVIGRTQVDDSKNLFAKLNKIAGIKSELVIFIGETHGSVVPAAISRGVTFALNPNAKKISPAVKRKFEKADLPIAVPTAAKYTALTPQERYDMRVKIRSWPKQKADRWVSEFKYKLDAALWYDNHYGLHAEKVLMDKKNAVTPKIH